LEKCWLEIRADPFMNFDEQSTKAIVDALKSNGKWINRIKSRRHFPQKPP